MGAWLAEAWFLPTPCIACDFERYSIVQPVAGSVTCHWLLGCMCVTAGEIHVIYQGGTAGEWACHGELPVLKWSREHTPLFSDLVYCGEETGRLRIIT